MPLQLCCGELKASPVDVYNTNLNFRVRIIKLNAGGVFWVGGGMSLIGCKCEKLLLDWGDGLLTAST